MSLIKTKSEVSVSPKIKMLIFGEAGSGKSTLAMSAPNPLLIDTDNGFYRMNQAHWGEAIVQVSKEARDKRVAEAIENGLALDPEDSLYGMDAINHILDNVDLSDYETIVIDTFGKLQDYMIEDIISKNGGKAKIVQGDGTLAMGGYGVLKNNFANLCRKINSKGKHVVFVAHDKDAVIKGAEYAKKTPAVVGSSYTDVKTELDMIMYLQSSNGNRVVRCSHSDAYESKNSIGLPDSKLPIITQIDPTTGRLVGLANTFLTDMVINPYVAYMEGIAKDVKLCAQVKAQALALINGANTLEEINQVMKDVLVDGGTFQHAGNSKAEAVKAFKQKVALAGFMYNKELGEYEQGNTQS